MADDAVTLEPIQLNLGAGGRDVPGYISVDRSACGSPWKEAYPMQCEDASVEDIRASHVLEHFSHTEVSAVLNHWVSKLKPGGRLRIAVPDFEFIAREYLAGKPINVQGYLMGGHIDENDRHGCAFDREVLEELLLNAGLERLHTWQSEIEDCASLPVSLNLGGYKPSGPKTQCKNTTAILSAPRYGPTIHMRCASKAFHRAGVAYQIAGGAYWHQVLSELLESQIEHGSKYIITCDFDTVFSYEDVLELYRLMEAIPDADAICPLQSRRGEDPVALFGITRKDGAPVEAFPSYHLDRHLMPITTGHFGLTIFRAERLASLDRPWMNSEPNRNGRWADGKVDADIQFWHHWNKSGRTFYLAPRIVIGHLQEMISWPNTDLTVQYQTVNQYDVGGMPPEVRR